MAAYLYPGVKSLHLVLDKPYDTVRTTDVRDDLQSVKVWYSTTTGFDPNNGEGTLVPSGNSLSVIITNLQPNTRYYVKYAFISAIDSDEVDPVGPTGPGSYTVSNELTQVVYDENVTVYGYLTNDPTGIATAADGTGGNFSLATGTFKVYDVSQDVTGAGPVYSIKANSNSFLTGATINATTGVYSCTGMTANSGSVTFLATYKTIVVEQVWNVYKGIAGANAPLIQLSATNSDFVFKDQFATTSLTTNTVLTAALKNITGTVVFTAKAYTRAGALVTTPGNLTGDVAFTTSGNTITITGTQFAALGVTVGTVVVTATIGTVTDSFTLYRINDGTEQITVELSNSAHLIPATNDGTTVAANYVGSGTTVRVKQGNTYLPVDQTSPYDSVGTWNIFDITSVGITCDPTPTIASNYIDFDAHAAMTADAAYIDYTIYYRTTTGQTGSQVVRQSFAKSKEGSLGSDAQVVNITATRQAFVLLKNTTTATPDNIVLTATASNFTTPTYTWLLDGVVATTSASTANGILYTWSVGVGQAATVVATAIGNTFTLNKFTDVRSKSVKVTTTEGSLSAFDIYTVYSLREGDDSIAVGLSNENQSISCDSTGTPITGQFPITSDFYVAQGINLLNGTTTPAATFAKVAYDGGNDASYSISSAGVITISSINKEFASAEFSATVNGTTYYKILTLNKALNGATGTTGTNTARVALYAKNTNSTTAPATFTGTFTYTFSGSALTTDGTLNTWSTTAPSITKGEYLWARYAVAASNTGSDTIPAAEFSAAAILSIGGSDGAAGINTARVALFAKNTNSTTPPTAFTGTFTYTFSGSALTTDGTLNTWSTTAPSIGKGEYLWARYAVAASNTGSDTIAITEFSAATILSSGGIDGNPGGTGATGPKGVSTRVAYQLVAQSATSAPAYTATTNGDTSVPTNGASVWTLTAPTATVGNVVWYSYGRYNADDTSLPQGIAVGKTNWSAPIAASVFQDIRSDNWKWNNGTSDQTGAPNLTAWKTYPTGVGYYFKKDDGTLWATSAYLKGNVLALGTTTDLQVQITVAGGPNYVYPALGAFSNTELPENIAKNIRAGIVGVCETTINSTWNVGLIGTATGTGTANTLDQFGNPVLDQFGNPVTYTYIKGVGVFGSGDAFGGVFETKLDGATGLFTRNTYATGYALRVEGASGFTGAVSVTGDITATGNITAYSSSDRNLKENILVIKSALDKLHSIGGYTYDWKDSVIQSRGGEDGYFVRKSDVGVIAQEVLEVVPQAVATRADGTLAVDYQKLIPLLIEAVKELDRRTR